jgi:hypothetical protein
MTGTQPATMTGDRTPAQITIPSLASPRVVTAVEHIRRMRGGSQPHLLRCSDGRFYVVKFQNNPQNTRILVNEYLGGKLARLLGLPNPDVSLIDLPQEFVHRTPELFFELPRQNRPIQSGLAFGSEHPSTGTGAHRTLQPVLELRPKSAAVQIENISDLFGILIFDKWTSNTDDRQIRCVARSPKLPTTLRMFMIDNGFCFGGPDWSFKDLPGYGLYLDRSIYGTFQNLQTLEPWLNRLEANVSLEKLTQITEEIPESWVKDDRDELLKMVKRLYERKKKVLALVRLSLNLVNRGTCIEYARSAGAD